MGAHGWCVRFCQPWVQSPILELASNSGSSRTSQPPNLHLATQLLNNNLNINLQSISCSEQVSKITVKLDKIMVTKIFTKTFHYCLKHGHLQEHILVMLKYKYITKSNINMHAYCTYLQYFNL